MAWTVPTAGADFAVSEVVTAAKMNSHVTDNLRYLKGLAGNITFESGIIVQPTPSGTALVRASVPTTADFAVMELVGGRTWQFGTGGSATGAPYASGFYISDQTAGQLRMLIDSSGNVGFGTSSPLGKITAAGAGGGFVFLSANAVDGTLQTLVPAASVAQFAAFWGVGRNNTGGGMSVVSGNQLTPGLSFNFPAGLTDTVTVALTAGGAITVQRTAGTNATHQVNLLVLYK